MQDRVGTLGDVSGHVRALAPSEQLFFAIAPGMYVGYSCLCAGDLDLAALDDAFGELQRQHPVLRSVIQGAGFALEFVAHGPDVPLARARVFPGEDPFAQATGRSAVFDQAERLTQLDVIPGPSHTRVTLFVHHSAADGHHALALLQELWERYAHRVETGERLPERPQPFPQSFEHYLATREHSGAGQSPDLAGPPAELFAELGDVVVQPNATLPLRVRLSQAETQSLIELGHAEGIKLNAFVAAALVRANSAADGAPPFCSYVVDLRDRVVPPVGFTEATNMIRNTTFSPGDRADSLIELARQIGDQLVVDLASGAVHTGAAQALLFAPHPSGVVNSTNWGRVPALRTPPALRIVDFQSFFPPSPASAAAPQADSGVTRTYVIVTFDGQLSVEALAGEADPQAHEIFERIGEELRAVILAHAG